MDRYTLFSEVLIMYTALLSLQTSSPSSPRSLPYSILKKMYFRFLPGTLFLVCANAYSAISFKTSLAVPVYLLFLRCLCVRTKRCAAVCVCVCVCVWRGGVNSLVSSSLCQGFPHNTFSMLLFFINLLKKVNFLNLYFYKRY